MSRNEALGGGSEMRFKTGFGCTEMRDLRIMRIKRLNDFERLRSCSSGRKM